MLVFFGSNAIGGEEQRNPQADEQNGPPYRNQCPDGHVQKAQVVKEQQKAETNQAGWKEKTVEHAGYCTEKKRSSP
jgi:hypothetical protein